jgi:hypothetical protein
MSSKQKPKTQPTAGPADNKPSQQKPAVDADLFRVIWNAAPTLRDAAERLGLAASTCANYADRLRQAGHALKEFLRGRPRLLKM